MLFIRSRYTFNTSGSDKERLFCDTFEEYINKLYLYLHDASDFTVNNETKTVYVIIGRPLMMKKLLPYYVFPREFDEQFSEETKIIKDICGDRLAQGSNDVGIIHPTLSRRLTTKQALDALNPLRKEIKQLFIVSEDKEECEIYFLYGHFPFCIRGNRVFEDEEGFHFDLDDGFRNKSRKVTDCYERFIENKMNGPIMLNGVETKRYFSDNDDFFSKEIKEIDVGSCMESYPCQHSDIKVTYVDGTIKHFTLGGYTMKDLCKKYNKPYPEHFKYMEDRDLGIDIVDDEDNQVIDNHYSNIRETIMYSDSEEFFSKEIKEIDVGSCMESYPCQHSDIEVTYVDGTIKHFALGGHTMRRLVKKYNKPYPEHFKYMENCRL